MNALDMVYHLSTGWAVHLNYVAVKLTVIFLSVWMITQFIGIGKEEGIVAGILGPLIFYVYYVFAGATLNREIFRIDEQFWFVFLHIALMILAYFAMWNFIKSKKHWLRTAGFVITAGLNLVALDALFVMLRWHLHGINEETSAAMMTLGTILVPVLSFISAAILGVLAEKFTNKKYLDMVTAAIFASAAIGFYYKDLTHAIFALIFVILTYLITHTVKKNLASAS